MFTRRFQLFSILGFRIGIDLSWFFLAALIVWSLATGFFPDVLPGLGETAYYTMAVAGAAGMFASIVYHELAHALVARYYQIKIAGITLFIFGGVAELEDEPPTAKSEFLVAVAGPVSSFLMAGALILAVSLLPPGTRPEIFTVLDYLSLINIVLAVFNLVPAFPLDGGRMLRAGLWWWTGNLYRATRIAAILGAGLGIGLMLLGAYNASQGIFVGGMWQILIGFFIFNAAGTAQRQTEVMAVLRGVKVGQLMKAPPPSIPAETGVEQVTEHPALAGQDIVLPVTENGRLIGVIQPSKLAGMPGEARSKARMGDLAEPLGAGVALSPDQSAISALRQLDASPGNQALVVEGGAVVGWIADRDIFAYIDMQSRTRKPEAGTTRE